MASDMPEPCKFQPLVNCQMMFLWTQKETDLAPHPVVSLVLQVGDAEVSTCTWFQKPGSFSPSQQARSMFQNHRGGQR